MAGGLIFIVLLVVLVVVLVIRHRRFEEARAQSAASAEAQLKYSRSVPKPPPKRVQDNPIFDEEEDDEFTRAAAYLWDIEHEDDVPAEGFTNLVYAWEQVKAPPEVFVCRRLSFSLTCLLCRSRNSSSNNSNRKSRLSIALRSARASKPTGPKRCRKRDRPSSTRARWDGQTPRTRPALLPSLRVPWRCT